MRPLSNIQEQIDRSIEYALYYILVVNGYLPDRQVYANNPAGYKTAMETIKNTRGFAIDLFGHGSSQDKEIKTIPRIVVEGLGFQPGDTGNDFGPSYIAMEDGTFNKIQETPIFSNYKFDIHLISTNAQQDRILEAVRQAAIPTLGYFAMYNDPLQKIMIEHQYTRQNPDVIHGLIQKTYSYEAKDIKEQTPEVLQSNISKIKEIRIIEVEESTPLIFKKSNTLVVNGQVTSTEDTNTILN